MNEQYFGAESQRIQPLPSHPDESKPLLREEATPAPESEAGHFPRRPIWLSMLWFPQSATVCAIIYVFGYWLIEKFGIIDQQPNNFGQADWIRFGVAGLIVAPLLALLISHLQKGRGFVGWLRSYFGVLSMPGALWTGFFAGIIYLAVRYWLATFATMTVLTTTYFFTDGFKQMNPLTWVVVILLSCATFGGVRWGNQYASGVSGGVSGFAIVGCFLVLLGLVGTIVAGVVLLIGIAPLSVAVAEPWVYDRTHNPWLSWGAAIIIGLLTAVLTGLCELEQHTELQKKLVS